MILQVYHDSFLFKDENIQINIVVISVLNNERKHLISMLGLDIQQQIENVIRPW